MLKKTCFAFAALAVTFVPASVHADTTYNLSLHVPVMCSIVDAYSTNPEQGLITVVTSCNAENYGLSFGGSLNGLTVVSSSNSNGSAMASADYVAIRAASPGLSQTLIQIDGDLTGLDGATLSLSAF